MAAGRAGPARQQGALGGARGGGLRHDHGRDARLRRGHRGRPLGRPGGGDRGCRAGQGHLVGERRGVPERPVRARAGRRVHRHGRYRARDAASVPASAGPGEVAPAAGDGQADRRSACRDGRDSRDRRRADARPDPRAAGQGGVDRVRRGGGGAVGPRAGTDGQVQHRPCAAGRRVGTRGDAGRSADRRRQPLRGAEGVAAADGGAGQPLPRRLVQGDRPGHGDRLPCRTWTRSSCCSPRCLSRRTPRCSGPAASRTPTAGQGPGPSAVVPCLLRDPHRRAAGRRRPATPNRKPWRSSGPRPTPPARRRRHRPGAVPGGAPPGSR